MMDYKTFQIHSDRKLTNKQLSKLVTNSNIGDYVVNFVHTKKYLKGYLFVRADIQTWNLVNQMVFEEYEVEE